MTKLLEAVHLDSPDSMKRFLVLVFSLAALLLAPLVAKLGIPMPDDTQIAAFAGVVAAFLAQSGLKAALAAKAAGDAAGAAATPSEAAAKVLEVAGPKS